MNRADTQIILLADAPSALVELCGITLLERLLRILQRLDGTRALVISATPEAIRGEVARLTLEVQATLRAVGDELEVVAEQAPGAAAGASPGEPSPQDRGSTGRCLGCHDRST